MKKRILMLLMLFALLITPVFAELELGFGLTPVASNNDDGTQNQDSNFFEDSLKTFHFGLRWWFIFYGSLDSMVVPPAMAQELSSPWIEDPSYPGGGYWGEGYFRPAFLNIYDIGFKLALGPLSGSAQLGVNTLYLYKQNELKSADKTFNSNLGANIKIAAGLKFGRALGIEAAALSVQPSIKTAVQTVRGLFAESESVRTNASQRFRDTLLYSFMLVLYLK